MAKSGQLLVGRLVHVLHQVAQLFDGVVHRVGDRPGDVLGHRGLLRQVALGHQQQLVHQAQNRRLIGIVQTLGVLLAQQGGLMHTGRIQQAPAACADVGQCHDPATQGRLR